MAIVTFNYTGAEQTWTVPSGVTSIKIKCWGAEGGNAGLGTDPSFDVKRLGGKGGYAEGDLAVTPGETLYIYVGEYPTGRHTTGSAGPVSGGWNGGGQGYRQSGGNQSGAGGGGGASDVRQGGNALANRVIVAGGGGSGSVYAGTLSYSGVGGNGGASTGQAGQAPGQNGQGGTQSAGGAGSTGGDVNGAAGTLGVGGNAAGNINALHPGSGGGGYYGGGGGGRRSSGPPFASGAGGGGSNYVGGVTNTVSTAGVRSGNGLVQIEYADDTYIDGDAYQEQSSSGSLWSTQPYYYVPRRVFLWHVGANGKRTGVVS